MTTEAQATEAPKRPPTLAEITDRILGILEQTEGGELTPELEAELDLAGVDLKLKVDAYKHAVIKMRADAKARAEIARPYLQESKAIENRAERLVERVHEQMKRLGVRELQGNTGKIALQRNGAAALVIDGEPPIPDELARVERSVDTTRLRELLAKGADLPLVEINGERVPFPARLVTGDHVRFR